MAINQRFTVNMWFDHEAEQAANYYTSIFKNSSIGNIARYGKAGHEIHKMEEGTVLTVQFFLDGQEFLALNGGPIFKFNEAISIVVNCETQDEIDYYWGQLTRDGDSKAQQCGWLKDRYGVSWQIVPKIMNELMVDAPNENTESMMQAMFTMKKLDIAKLKHAYDHPSLQSA